MTNALTTTQTIPGNDRYLLTHDDVVVSIANMTQPIPVTDGNVTIALYGYVHTVSLDWLKKYCKYHIYLPKRFQNRVSDIEFKPYSLHSHGVEWDDIAVFKKPMSIVFERMEYRIVPMYTFLAVSSKGDVLNLNSRTMAKYSNCVGSNPDFYPRITIVLPKYMRTGSRTKTMANHRLVAMAWIPNDNYVDKPIVDHKDGNKKNCHASNLEWVSFSTNNARTAQQGLRTDNISVKVMDYKEQLVTVFGSMTQACVFMNRSRINRLEEFCSNPTLVNGRYQIKLLSDLSDWDFNDSTDGDYCVTIDGKRKCYSKLTDIMIEHFPDTNLRPNLGVVKKMLTGKYPDIIINFPEPTKLANDTYQVLEVATGEVTEHKTRKDVVNYTGLSKSSVAKYLNLGPDHAYNGYCIRVKSDDSWPNKDTVSIGDNKSVPVVLKKISTGEIFNCRSLREASVLLCIDKKFIDRIHSRQDVYNGYMVVSM